MKHPFKTAALFFVAALLGPLAPVHAQDTCYSGSVPAGADYALPPGQTCQIPGNYYDVNFVANDYAILYFDAKKPGCTAAARDRLEAKLRAKLNYANSGGRICDPRRDTNGALPATNPFQPAFAGAMATGIFSTAVALLDRGYTLDDTLLRGVRDHMAGLPSPQDPWCGTSSLPNVNSCMDDYTVTAAGFGWISAYEARRGRTTDAANWASRTRTRSTRPSAIGTSTAASAST